MRNHILYPVLAMSIQAVFMPEMKDISWLLTEVAIFLIAVLLGSGVSIAMRCQKRTKVTTREILVTVFLGLSLGFAAKMTMDYYDSNLPRPVIIWVVSVFSEMIMLQAEKKFPKIFDGMFEKTTGINIKDEDDEV